jgi:hypothetical protein
MLTMRHGSDAHGGARFRTGFGWGIVATIAMSVVMLAGTVSGRSPMPKPIPVALVATIFGAGLPKPALVLLGAAAHLLYGGTFAGVLALVARPITIWKGIGLAVVLWLVMQLVWLPVLGWGVFGIGITPAIAVATLMLHLIYGVTAGWLIDRRASAPLSPAAGRGAGAWS